jgi:hypothetical protein
MPQRRRWQDGRVAALTEHLTPVLAAASPPGAPPVAALTMSAVQMGMGLDERSQRPC